jgi:hypothetical protein
MTPNIDIKDNKEHKRWDYTNKYSEWEGGNSARWQTQTE